MDTKQIGFLIGAFIVILVGVIFANSIADSLYLATTISTVTENESVTFTSKVGQTANADILSITFLGNGTDSTHTASGSFVIDESVNITKKSTGEITINDSGSVGTYNVTYTYEGTEYVTDSTSRTLISFTTLFFAIAVVLVGYVLVMRSYTNIRL